MFENQIVFSCCGSVVVGFHFVVLYVLTGASLYYL